MPSKWELDKLKQWVGYSAAQRPDNIKALFQKYSAWMQTHPGWQTKTYEQLAASSGPAAGGTTQQPAGGSYGGAAGIGTPIGGTTGGATGGTTGGATGGAPGPGGSQSPIEAGGVWWGGKFYDTPYKLRVALGFGKPNDQDRAKWNQWLAAHPSIAQWSSWYSQQNGGGANNGEPPPSGTPGGLFDTDGDGYADMIDTDGDGVPDQIFIDQGGMPQTPAPPYDLPGGGTTTPTPTPGVAGTGDYSGILGIAGLPADVVAYISNIFKNEPDPNRAAALALAYVRGTAWYAATFPGINVGIQHGLFEDERGYRDYRNALDQVYRQWTGGPVDAASLQAALGEGVDPDIVSRRFEGQAWATANQPDLRYLSGAFGTSTDLGRAVGGDTMFTPEEQKQLGYEKAGLGTVGGAGMKIDRAFELARARFQRIFQGQEATPNLALRDSGRLYSPGIGLGARKPDIGS